MISFNNISIRRKIVFIILIVTFLSGSIGSIFDIYEEHALAKEALVAESYLIATLVSEYSITPLDFGYQDEAEAVLAKLVTMPSIYNGVIYNTNGQVFATYNRYQKAPVPIIPTENPYNMFEGEWLHVYRSITYKGVHKGTIYLRITTAEISQRLKTHLIIMVLIGLGVMAVAYILATSLQNLISKPILTLVDLTRRVSQEADYSVRGKKTTSDEIGSLYDGFNNMLEQIQLRTDESARAEEFLRLSEEKYRLLFERSSDAVFLVNIDTGQYLDANHAAEVLTRRSKDELISLTTADISPSEANYRLDALKTGGSLKELPEVEYVRPDGSIRTALLSTVPLKGNVFYGIARDITEQKDAEVKRLAIEKQLQQSQKLEALGAVVGGIAHEFNNILQSLFLYAEIVQDQLPDNGDLHANFQHIIDDGKRARDIVKQILTFSRKSKIDMKPRAVQKIILDALLFERASLPPNIEIKQSIDLNCGLVLCDKTQIHQIIINLCNNAQQAIGDDNGILNISLQEIKANLGKGETEQRVLELKVSDTGKGIDAETQSKIFDPFFTTKAVGQGTGLGLSVIYGIIELMKGTITVTSKIGQGTTFTILIPTTKNQVNESNNPSATRVNNIGKTILLVDDEESIRVGTRAMLNRKGFVVDTAESGNVALKLFRENPDKYDLIVTDLSMPKLSGVELTRDIRETGSDIPIILSSGNLGIADQKEYQDVGISSFLEKPWTIKQLFQRIHDLDK